MSDFDVLPPKSVYEKISGNIQKVMRGQSAAIRKLLSAFASGGHVLLEDYPGTGKTTFAKALSLSINSQFKRIQFTPDLLPSDILGVSIYDQKENRFHFHKGPVFTNILLADEINRASPRTQSALLEAMAESHVSIDGNVYLLENLFFVIGTQNPVESSGTYPLPEAQMDRFSLRFSLGYVSPEEEVAILSDQDKDHPINKIKPCVSMENVLSLKDHVKEIRISDELKRYIVDIVSATRTADGVELGASPRASLSIMKTTQALALFDGKTFVTPEYVQEIAVSVIAHRMVMNPQARFSGRTAQGVVDEILKTMPVPT
ncbi:MAG: MoxR family ATPase [Deltaproteobacteria bacterium]|nr:MoxR family ATPase [Deltaproteobacteria bacterium]